MPILLIYLSKGFYQSFTGSENRGNKQFHNNSVMDLLLYVLVPVGGGKNLKEGRNPEEICSFPEGKNKTPLFNF